MPHHERHPPVMTDYGRFDGTIGGIRFAVTYAPGCGWKGQLNAC